MLLYKYRDFSNLQNALDIIVNQRLYAAAFETLNDPMEGEYRYNSGALTQVQIDNIYTQKNEWHILSLSEEPDNLLMWSYYGSSHSGMVVGVEVPNQKDVKRRQITYDNTLSVAQWGPDLAIEILSRKLDAWKHEKEHRIFKRKKDDNAKGSYVKVVVKEVIFGTQTNESLKALVQSIAKKFCPNAKITTIKKENLNRGAVRA